MEYLTTFTPIRGLVGGILIGFSAVLFLWSNGRIAGISGFIHGICPPVKRFDYWRLTFLLGLLVGGLGFYTLPLIQFPLRTHYPVLLLLLGGFCVGYGTRMGSGCTSGHGICGVARLSKRSITATLLFIISGIVTVFILRHILGIY